MKLATLMLLICLTPSITTLQADQSEQALTPPTSAQYSELQQQLALAEQTLGEQQSSHALQLKRLRDELKRQHQQLKDLQAQLKPPLFSVEQTWFLIGAGVSLLAAAFGALLRGRRKPQRSWIN